MLQSSITLFFRFVRFCIVIKNCRGLRQFFGLEVAIFDFQTFVHTIDVQWNPQFD